MWWIWIEAAAGVGFATISLLGKPQTARDKFDSS